MLLVLQVSGVSHALCTLSHASGIGTVQLLSQTVSYMYIRTPVAYHNPKSLNSNYRVPQHSQQQPGKRDLKPAVRDCLLVTKPPNKEEFDTFRH